MIILFNVGKLRLEKGEGVEALLSDLSTVTVSASKCLEPWGSRVKANISTHKAIASSGELLFYCHEVILLKVEKLFLIKCKMWFCRNFSTFNRFPCEYQRKVSCHFLFETVVASYHIERNQIDWVVKSHGRVRKWQTTKSSLHRNPKTAEEWLWKNCHFLLFLTIGFSSPPPSQSSP